MSDALHRLTFVEPTAEDFASLPSPAPLVNSLGWTMRGTWRFRQFGQETQLRCNALPHLAMDLWRGEAEDLYVALGAMLGQPAPMPYRVPWWTRLAQWGARKVWDRKNHETRARARAELIDEFSRRSPWG